MYGVAPYSTAPYCAPFTPVTSFPVPIPAVVDPLQNQQFDFSVNMLQALLWQYNTAPNLLGLLQDEQDWYAANQTDFWNNWITNVFDLRTANDFGCAVWSVILDMPLNIEYTTSDGKNFGFGPYTGESFPNGAKNFNRGNFAPKIVEPLSLTTEYKRLALQMRYFKLLSRGTPLQINAYFARIFATLGPAYVVDNLNMTMTYHFAFSMPAQLLFLINFYNLLPRPAGVSISYVTV